MGFLDMCYNSCQRVQEMSIENGVNLHLIENGDYASFSNKNPANKHERKDAICARIQNKEVCYNTPPYSCRSRLNFFCLSLLVLGRNHRNTSKP
jgi:hypothetical protein